MHFRLSLVVPITAAVAAIGCSNKPPSLPAETAEIDLTSAGTKASLRAPASPRIAKNPVDGFDLTWESPGRDGFVGSLHCAPALAKDFPLRCTAIDDECTAVESAPDYAIVAKKVPFSNAKGFGAVAFVSTGGATFGCSMLARTREEAKRLAGAALSLKASESLDPLAATSAPPASALEEVKDAAMGYTIKVPQGSKPLVKSAATHKYQQNLPNGRDYVAVTITPTKVASLAQAESEIKHRDVGGLDAIAEKSADGPGKFSLATSPRGKAGIVKYNTFVKAKGKTLWAECEGTAATAATAKQSCATLGE